jgi:hypothetical protein
MEHLAGRDFRLLAEVELKILIQFLVHHLRGDT